MKSMITVGGIITAIQQMIKEYEMIYHKRPTIAYMGEGQIQALGKEDLLYSTIGEEFKIYGLRIEGAHAADFIGVGGEENEMSAISPELVKARAEMMLGKHLRDIEYPSSILLGNEQMRAAVKSISFDLSPHTGIKYFCGVKIKEIPIPNYIGVM